MPAPFPYDAAAKRLSLEQISRELLGHYTWIARWSDEIGTDTDLDLKKLAQLSFVHCRRFDAILALFDPIDATSPIMRAFEAQAAGRGLGWLDRVAMEADIALIRTEAAALFAFVRDSVPEARSFATRTYDAQGKEIEQATKITKTAAIADEVTKLRVLFA